MTQEAKMDSKSFGAYVGDIMAKGYLSAAIAIGEDTGLIRTMCDLDHPATVEEIAEKNSLKERYVKEWLGAMVSGKIVEVDSDSKFYFLPLEYRSRLKGSDMVWFQAKMVQGEKWSHLKTCFKKDGPSGYCFSEFSEMYNCINTWRECTADGLLNRDILPTLTGATDKLEAGGSIIDLGCGSGNFAVRLASRFPKSTFIGVDYGELAIEQARNTADDQNLENITFECADAANLPESWTEKFDIVFVYDVIHDTSNPLKILNEIARILQKDGIFYLVEVNTSSSQFENRDNLQMAMLYSISLFSCLPSSLSDPPHAGLGTCWGLSEMRKTLKSSGFHIESEALVNNNQNVSFVCRKAS